jgi:hypothetical protein
MRGRPLGAEFIPQGRHVMFLLGDGRDSSLPRVWLRPGNLGIVTRSIGHINPFVAECNCIDSATDESIKCPP